MFGRKPQPSPEPEGDPILDRKLLDLSPADPWTVRHAVEGTQIFGAIGSGKTSGSGAAIARAFLGSGFGGLVLCAKPDEPDLWREYARRMGRTGSLLFFGPSHPYTFNFLDYELRRSGAGAGQTHNLVELFLAVMELSDGRRQLSNDGFWDKTLRQLVQNAIDVLIVAKGQLTLQDISQMISSAPPTPEAVVSPSWVSSSFCFQMIERGMDLIEAGKVTEVRRHDFMEAARHWTSAYPRLNERTRSIIDISFTSMADSFLRGEMRRLFCTTTNIVPELSHQGQIFVLDMSLKEWSQVGRFAQVLFKFLWQKATERRTGNQKRLPVFLWADEAQFFATKYDALFQSTGRSSLACTVYLTQNLPSYRLPFDDESAAESFVGNLNTKFFHANSDAKTNTFAADMIGRGWQQRASFGMSDGEDPAKGSKNKLSTNFSDSFEYDVPPQAFTVLRKGGPENNRLVEGIVFQTGRIWKATGKNYLRVGFKQN